MGLSNILSDNKSFSALVYKLIGFILVVIILKSFVSSPFIRTKDRINFVVYDKYPVFYSISLKNTVNYAVPWFADLKMQVPGGYSYYRLGGLKKLIDLEKKPELFKKTFSYNSSSFVNYYFYPGKTEVYYGADKQKILVLPDFYKIFLFKSNASFFERLYLFFRLFGVNQGNFNIIDDYPVERKKSEKTFLQEEFFKKFQGYFYQAPYRKEKKTVQIIYTSNYKSAVGISNILEGNGIRVVDLSLKNNKQKSNSKNCQVVEDQTKFSKTARDMTEYFRCSIAKDNTGTFDIILKLESIEKEWETD